MTIVNDATTLEVLNLLTSITTGHHSMHKCQERLYQLFNTAPIPTTQHLLTLANSTTIINDAPVPPHSRSLAIIFLTKQLPCGEIPLITTFPDPIQAEIQAFLLKALMSEKDRNIARYIMQFISRLAEVMLYTEIGWESLLPFIFHTLSSPLYPNTQTRCENPLLSVYTLQLLSTLSQYYFDGLMPHLNTIMGLLNTIYSPQQLEFSINTIEHQVYGVQLIRNLVIQPEIDDSNGHYWAAIYKLVGTIVLPQHSQYHNYLSLIITWLIDIIVEDKEIDFFKPHIQEITQLFIAICKDVDGIDEHIRLLSLEFLIQLVELRPQFVNGVPNAASKKSTTKKGPTTTTPNSVILLQSLAEITFVLMADISCDKDWLYTCPLDDDNNNNSLFTDDQSIGAASTQLSNGMNDEDYLHNTGLYTFARLVGVLSKPRLITHILPTIFNMLALPSLPIQQLPAQDPRFNLANGDYNQHWIQHVVALTALAQVLPLISNFADLPLAQVFTLLTSAHPRVQYNALLAISSMAMEYHTAFTTNTEIVCPAFFSAIPALLAQYHLPRVQQTACSVFQVFLSEMGFSSDHDSNENVEKLKHNKNFIENSENDGDLIERRELHHKISTIFTQDVTNGIFNVFLSLFNHYHTNVTTKIGQIITTAQQNIQNFSPSQIPEKIREELSYNIGVQLYCITTLAELSQVTPQTFLPHLGTIIPLLTSLLNQSAEEALWYKRVLPQYIHLQAKVIEGYTYICSSLHQFCISSKTGELHALTLASSDLAALDGLDIDIIRNSIQFAQHVVTFYNNYIMNPSPQIDIKTPDYNELLLKYSLRGLTRLCRIIPAAQFIPFIPFSLKHVIYSLLNSIKNKVINAGNYSFNSVNTIDTEGNRIDEASQSSSSQDNDINKYTNSHEKSNNIDIFYEDVIILLSMLQAYCRELRLLLLPYTYDIVYIALYYVNYPSNVEIQQLSCSLLPSILSIFNEFIIINVHHGENIISYPLYNQEQAYFNQFLNEQQLLIKNDIKYSQIPPFYYATTLTKLQTNGILNHYDIDTNISHNDNSTDDSTSTSIFSCKDQMGYKFVLPTNLQVLRATIYIIEYLMYIIQLEIDHDASVTLLSALACCVDEITFISPNLLEFQNATTNSATTLTETTGTTMAYIIFLLFDYLYYLTHKINIKLKNAVNQKLTMINSLLMINNNTTNAYVDDDDDEDDEQDDEANENENDQNNTTDGVDVTVQNIVYIPLEQVPVELQPFYAYQPLEEQHIATLIQNSDYYCEQVLMILTRVVKSVIYPVMTYDCYNITNHLTPAQNIFITMLKYATNFAIYCTSTHQHYQQSVNPQKSPPLLQKLPFFVFQVQRYPYFLYHCLFNTFEDRIFLYYSRIVALLQSKNDIYGRTANNNDHAAVMAFFPQFITISHMLLQNTFSVLGAYVSTYNNIKAAATCQQTGDIMSMAHFKPVIVLSKNGKKSKIYHTTNNYNMSNSTQSTLAQYTTDTNVYIKLLHNLNPSVLLEHLTYAVGLFAQYFFAYQVNLYQPTAHYTGIDANAYHTINIGLCKTIFTSDHHPNKVNINLYQLLELLCNITTHYNTYIALRFPKAYHTIQQHYNPFLPSQIINTTAKLKQTQANLHQIRLDPIAIQQYNEHDEVVAKNSIYSVMVSSTCELYLYGYDNVAMAYGKWILSILQVSLLSSLPPVIEVILFDKINHTSFINKHLTYFFLYYMPLTRDMNECNVLYTLFCNMLYKNNMFTNMFGEDMQEELYAMFYNNSSHNNGLIESSSLIQYLLASTTQSLYPQQPLSQAQQSSQHIMFIALLPLLSATIRGFLSVDIEYTIRIALGNIINDIIQHCFPFNNNSNYIPQVTQYYSTFTSVHGGQHPQQRGAYHATNILPTQVSYNAMMQSVVPSNLQLVEMGDIFTNPMLALIDAVTSSLMKRKYKL